ncbi:MAG: hypothetical protein RLZZ70_485 [Candidatus Parcubacteria bacterium]|jgi:nicotianamine synthase
METEFITSEIIAIANTLGACSSLQPSPVVDGALTRLVEIILTTPRDIATEVMTALRQEGIIERLQNYAMTAETALEHTWTHAFLQQSSLSWSDVKTFQYFLCYQALTALEMAELRTAAEPILFVGGGALPLSALIMAHDYNQPVRVIDNDADAVVGATALVTALGLNHLVEVVLCDVLDYIPTETNIILAAMVGGTSSAKSQVIKHLFTVSQRNTVALMRGVSGLAELLYIPQPPVKDWTELKTLSDLTVINCVHVWKKN